MQGEAVCGRYVPEDPDATLVEPPFAPRLFKSLVVGSFARSVLGNAPGVYEYNWAHFAAEIHLSE
jgi:hypothetical protein